MKKHLLKSLLALALVLITGNAWGETYSLTPNSASTGNSATAYVTSAYSFTYKDVSWSFNQWNPSTLQVKTNQSSAGSEFNFKNTTAFPGKITKVVITFSALTVSNASGLCFVGGTSEITSLSGGTAGTWNSTSKTLTWTPTGDCTYFAFYQNGKVASGTNKLATNDAIVVTYASTDPSISADDITIEADATSGEIAYTITNPVDGQSVTASTAADWISDFQYGDGTVTFTTAANTGAEREGIITLSYEGANNKAVTVTQKKATTFASLEALVAAGEPTTAGETVTVTFTDEVITKLYVSGQYTNGIGLMAGDKEIEIYCKDVPEEWVVGGTVSATLTCPWKKYNTTWELCPNSWDELSYTAPQTFSVIIDDEIANGAISASATEVAAGIDVTLTITPDEHYQLTTLTVTDASSNPVTVIDNKFTMPASDVTVSAEFVEKTKYSVTYANTQGYEMVYEGEKANVPVLESLRGWDFAGWTTTLNYTASTTAPTLFDGTVTGNTTLVAVYKKTVGSGEVSASLTNDDMKEIAGSYDTSSVTNDYGTWNYNACYQGNVKSDGEYFLQIRNNEIVSYLQIPEMPGEITSIVLEKVCNTSKGKYTGNIYFRTEKSNDANAIVTATSNEALEDITLNIPTGYKTGYIMSSGACRIYSVTVNYKAGTTTYSLYPSYTVNISSVGFATFYCKKAVTIPEGVTAYYAAYENKTITLNQVQGEVIHQGEGVVLKGEEGSYEFVPTSDVMEDAPNNALFGKEVESEYADLVDDDTYVYTLNVGSNGVSFYHMAESSSLAANRAYMLIPVEDFEAGAETIGFRFGDATQIENVNAVEAGKYFDLMGREVLNPAGGIYILNGKKVLVK